MWQDDVEALAAVLRQRIADDLGPEATSETGGGLVAVDLVAVDRETLAMQIFASEADLAERVNEQCRNEQAAS